MHGHNLRLFAILTLAVVMSGCASRQSNWVETKPRSVPPPPPVVHERLDPKLRETAETEIRQAFTSSDARIRANAIEAAQNTLGSDGIGMIAVGLNDRDSIVRFAAAMAVGKLKLQQLQDRVGVLADDPSVRVRIAARYALHRLGDTSRSQELVALAQSPNARVREDVAFVLGLLGEKSAVKILQRLVGDNDGGVRLQAADSLWRLGQTQGLELLASGMVSQFVDDQMLCLLALSAPGDARVGEIIRGKLTDPYQEVALVAARAMGELGSDLGYSVATEALGSPDPRKRYLAVTALGMIGRSDAQSKIAPLLKDQDPRVRLATAVAVLQLKEPVG